MSKDCIKIIKKLLGLFDSADEDISLHVLPKIHGGYGVYANKLLIANFDTKLEAYMHRQRLRNQHARR
jgi:hypothetical protein